MNRSAKLHGAAMLLIAVMAALVLSAALNNLRIGPGDPFPGAISQNDPGQPSVAVPQPPSGEMLPVFRGLLAVSFLVLGALLFRHLLSITRLKHVMGILAAMTLIALLLLSLPRLPAGGVTVLEPEAAAPPVPSAEYATAPLGTPPPSFVWLAGLLVLIGAGVAFIAAARAWPGAPGISVGLAAEASRALEEIEAGANATNVIVRCYLQMTGLIQKERRVSRERGMTVREFEQNLRDLGLPYEPMLRLRTLFEAVRYGDRQMSASEEQAALDCLHEVLSFLRGAA